MPRSAMRLLHARHDHVRHTIARTQLKPNARRDNPLTRRQSLQLHRLPTHRRSCRIRSKAVLSPESLASLASHKQLFSDSQDSPDSLNFLDLTRRFFYAAKICRAAGEADGRPALDQRAGALRRRHTLARYAARCLRALDLRARAIG